MKKIALSLSVLAMSVGFVACEDYDLPNPPAQSNPQDSLFVADNINISAIAEGETPTVINLQELNDADTTATVGTLKLTDWPAGYNLGVTMYVSPSEDMAGAWPVKATVTDSIVTVKPDDLNTAIKAFTKDPRQATFWVNYSATASLGETASIYIGGPDYRFGKYQLNFKPFDADFVIDDTYYLVNGDNIIELDHSDRSPYDDPIFRKVIEITADQAAAGYQWAVSTEVGKSYGGAELSGDLIEGTSGMVALSGPVMFEFNMKDFTYSIYQAYPCLYTPGPANGWNQAASTPIYTTDYVHYSGWALCDGEFKFDATLNWAVNWGLGDAEGTLASNSSKNIKVGALDCYFLTADLANLTYSATPITSCGVIGDATPAGWEGQTNLTQDANNPMIWEGTVHFAGKGEWKIRFNDNWDSNLGGELNDATIGGANIATPGEGDKVVTVNVSMKPYTITVR